MTIAFLTSFAPLFAALVSLAYIRQRATVAHLRRKVALLEQAQLYLTASVDAMADELEDGK